MYFKSKKELNYNRFVDPNILGASRLVHSDLQIYRISFFLLDWNVTDSYQHIATWLIDTRPSLRCDGPEKNPTLLSGRNMWLKWNEWGFRTPLCTYRFNWASRTSWGWWDKWNDTVLQTQDSKHGALRPSTLLLSHGGSPQYWIFTSEQRRNILFLWNLKSGVRTRDLRLSKQAALTTAPGPPAKGGTIQSPGRGEWSIFEINNLLREKNYLLQELFYINM